MNGNMPKGYITSSVFAGPNSLPISDATVIIRQNGENGRSAVIAVLVTASDGGTERIEITTPPREVSQAPSEQTPCAFCTVEVNADGYYGISFLKVPVYEGTTSIQRAEMLPYAYSYGENIFPRVGTLVVEGTLPNL